MRRYPNLYEINALAFLNRQSTKYGRSLSLATVPDDEWRSIADTGFDLIWMMGVWQRSPKAHRLALLNKDLQREFTRVLPGWTQQDVAGSPYAIYDYHLDPSLGQEGELAELRAKLNHMGIGLILDFVPNHLAIDHPWTVTYPERFVHGRLSDIKKHPDWFFSVGKSDSLAHGRDPYFAPWSDTVQVNFFSNDLRQALLSELERIAEVADGVRCDMAMLALNEVFTRVWGEVLGDIEQPGSDFWDEAITRVKQHHPRFIFIAEVYWGLDRKLQQMGFDFTYDKPLYDHLHRDSAKDIIEHLRSEGSFVAYQAHFIENHDEARAKAAFGRERSLAAATVMATIPGLRFYQHGQLEGCSVRIPVQLAREPVENVDAETMQFYKRLLSATNAVVYHEGQWKMIEVASAWEGNNSYRNILSWQWKYQDRRQLIALNYSPYQSQAWLMLGSACGLAGQVTLKDIINGTVYVRDAGELSTKGLFVDLQPYQAYILDADIGQSAKEQLRP